MANKSNLNNIKCGLGLRSEHVLDVLGTRFRPGFWEITPENWIHTPHRFTKAFEEIISGAIVVAHTVGLSIGSEPDMKFLKAIKNFLDRFEIKYYSDHICFCCIGSHNVHDLLPIPCNEQVLNKVCDNVDFVQNYLKRPIILENVTYYYSYPESQVTMPETEFINLIMSRTGAKLLLDVNNVYVNSINHSFNPYEFISNLNLSHLSYIHMAGHEYSDEDNLIIDTHGAEIRSEVFDLLKFTLKHKKVPTMIERDSNIPPLQELIKEYKRLEEIWVNA